ncbi:MAG TPA: hypothetical protein VEP90_17225, partial [Methylomirabilota bacterium]|nr:hypothetical protein [Methylomirabilota bacterium]
NDLSLIVYLMHLPHFLFQNWQTHLLFLLAHQLLIDASFLFYIMDFFSSLLLFFDLHFSLSATHMTLLFD